jgi:hypothetical protein
VVSDPEREHLLAVAGATGSRPLLVHTGHGPSRAEGITNGTAEALIRRAPFAGDAYEIRLHAVALSRAYDEAFRT